MRVLVVEDEMLIALEIGEILSGLGYEVVAMASRLDQAIEVASRISFDVAILDMNLAGELSLPLARMLQKRHLPFVFATGYKLREITDEFADAVTINKPFSEDELAHALEIAMPRTGRVVAQENLPGELMLAEPQIS